MNAAEVEFTAADLRALNPGDVRSVNGEVDGDEFVYVVQSEAGFAEHACEYVHDLYGTG